MPHEGQIAPLLRTKRALSGTAALATALLTAPLLAACGTSTSTAPLGSLPESPGTGPAGKATATVMSSGFDVMRDGFSFENYGNDGNPTNLTPAGMKALFGAKACARVTADGCTLTAPAATWMTVMNSAMSGGHCFGMAALVSLFFEKRLQPSAHGAQTTYGLPGDASVQGMIARLFVTQATSPEANTAERLPVKDVLDRLQRGWAQGKMYLLAIFTADGGGGHAITPIALTKLTGGQLGLVVYDNNYPGERKVIRVDPAANTWSYRTSSDPSEAADNYSGDARNQLTLYTPTVSLKEQDCTFCKAGDDGSSYVVLDEESAKAGVTVAVTDLAGLPLSGVTSVPWLSGGGGASESFLRVPGTSPFRVTMTGSHVNGAASGTVTVIGHGWTDQVAGVQLGSGEADSVDVTPRNGDFAYSSDDTESPVLSSTIDEGDTSYQFAFRGATIDADGGRLELASDPVKHVERITSRGAGKSVLKFAFSRVGPAATQTFTTDHLELGDSQALVAHYGAWKAGSALTVGVDDGGDGSVERAVQLQPR
jgi:hypothetical protein